MRNPGAQERKSERGQASVELLAVLPAALLVVLAAWQLVLAGQAAWLAANAARVAARAQTVGYDPEAAARSALPSYLRRDLRVRSGGSERVRVAVTVPLLIRAWSSPLRVDASAALPPQAEGG